jgi:serine/threonine protein phosphatase 1
MRFPTLWPSGPSAAPTEAHIIRATTRKLYPSPRGARPESGTRVYAIGDIHGRSDLLSDMIARIDDDLAMRPVARSIEIYLGDYIDRGPDSRGVIDLLCRRLVFANAICLRGNHEQVMEDFLDSPETSDHWLHLGGAETLRSYNVSVPDPAARHHMTPTSPQRVSVGWLPETHQLFLKCLRNSYRNGDYVFVHAGLRPGLALDAQRAEDLLWIREPFLTSVGNHGFIVVHGHTPVEAPEIHNNRINIDTGAVWTGQLTCLVLEESSLFFL